MQNKHNILHLLWLLAVMGLLTFCSTDTTSELSTDNDADGIPGESIRYVVNDLSQGDVTRALYQGLTQFSETVLNARGGKVTADNLIYNAGGSWVTTMSWTMPKSGKMTAYCISPTVDSLAGHLFDKNNHYFDYIVPVKKQSVIKIGSKLNFTASDVAKAGSLVINFKNATASLIIRATNKLELKLPGSSDPVPVQVYVKSVTMHNMKQKGRFAFSTTKNTDGTWTLDNDVYANYTQVLKNDQLITNGQNNPTDIVDSFMVVVPQSPEQWAWKPKATNPAPAEDAISVADANHKCYIELKCVITATIDNITYYVWGYVDAGGVQYESIYLPYVARNASPKYATTGASGIYIVRLQESTALDELGQPIQPHETSGMNDQFIDAQFINVSTDDGYGNEMVDDWEDEQDPVVIGL